ncbi:13191_t:CDS:2, partial [Racocetra fulgida]
MRDVVENEKVATGTDESKTDTLVDDLLRIADLNVWPLKILIIIKEKPYVSADLEFVVANRKLNMVAVEDKHIKNIYSPSGFGETQIAANIIACGDENIRATDNEEPVDETIFAMRVLSTYVTFYKAEIPAKYWAELSRGLPKTEVIVKRWPGENAKRKGLDLVEPNGRKAVLDALANIREFLLRHEQPALEKTTLKFLALDLQL